jgi:hypothetical protein
MSKSAYVAKQYIMCTKLAPGFMVRRVFCRFVPVFQPLAVP